MHRIWAGGPRQSLEESVHLPPVYRCFLTKLPPHWGAPAVCPRGAGPGRHCQNRPRAGRGNIGFGQILRRSVRCRQRRYSYLTILDPSSWEMPPGLSDTTCILSQSYCSAVEVFSPSLSAGNRAVMTASIRSAMASSCPAPLFRGIQYQPVIGISGIQRRHTAIPQH